MILNQIVNDSCFNHIQELKQIENVVIVTDPPFNIGYHYENFMDRKSEVQYYDELSLFLDFPCVMIHYPESLHRLSAHSGKVPERVVSWVYNSNTPRQHRDVAFYGVKPNFERLGEYKNQTDKRIKQLMEQGRKPRGYDWIECQQVKNVSKEKTKHPCQMPLSVMDYLIKTLPKNSVIVDPFSGSGTTLVSAKKNGFDFVGFEINESYVEIIKNRLDEIQQDKQ